MQYVQDSPFLYPATVSYPAGDNIVDATKTAVISDGYKQQTLTYNAAGNLLAASNVLVL